VPGTGLAVAATLGLSGCLASDTERGLVGAAGGAVILGVTGGRPDTGAVVGGAVGYFCRDLRAPGCIQQRIERSPFALVCQI
jgi:osmotically inducible lipoprotein OsmB